MEIYVMFVDNKITGWHDNKKAIINHMNHIATRFCKYDSESVVFTSFEEDPLRILIVHPGHPGMPHVIHDLRTELFPKIEDKTD